MRYLVKVRVNLNNTPISGACCRLETWDRSASGVRRTVCGRIPAVGFSLWEADGRDELNGDLPAGGPFYSEVESGEVESPGEAMVLLMQQMQGSRSASGEEGRVSVKAAYRVAHSDAHISGRTRSARAFPSRRD